MLTYGKCCRPIPDDLSDTSLPGKGIVVHIEGCGNLHDLATSQRNSPPAVGPAVEEYSVELRVELEHEKGIIATLASTIAQLTPI